MAISAVTPHAPAQGRVHAPSGLRPAAAAAAQAPELDAVALPARPLDLDGVASRWQSALDAAERALGAARMSLRGGELDGRQRALRLERQHAATTLAELARFARVQPAPWLSPVPITRQMLGLPPTAKACLFDLDGVLTDSAVLHAHAWAEVFDPLLLRVAENTGWHFLPFDRGADYRTFVDGRPRLEGIHAFLASRGIRLPEGRPDEPAEAETAYGLAKRKSEALARILRRRGVTALPGARRYLEAARRVGIARAVVSSSASTLPMLELAGLATLVDERVDADVIRAEGLRSRPAPDLLLNVCGRLGIRPEEAVAFTNSTAGVAAAHAAGVAIIGVGEGVQSEVLHGHGADRVVQSLGALLDRRLAASI